MVRTAQPELLVFHLESATGCPWLAWCRAVTVAVVSATKDDNKIAWYKNGGGSPPAWTPYTISTAAEWTESVFAADVDGDSRVDGTFRGVPSLKLPER